MDTAKDTFLITGGSAGIGRAFAEALHAKGAKVIITGRRREALAQIAAAHPGMDFAVLDMTDADAIAAFAAQVVIDHPTLNVVVNNAGVMIAEDLTAEPIDQSIVEEIITTNLLGPIRLTAALAPHLKRQRAATVVTVSSGLAFVPLALTPTYSATKAAIHSWSQSLRTQLAATSVRVVEWAPPAVATDLMPGHAQSPNSMPLDEFITESLALFEAGHDEVLVERVKFLHGALARGAYDHVYAVVNGPR